MDVIKVLSGGHLSRAFRVYQKAKARGTLLEFAAALSLVMDDDC